MARSRPSGTSLPPVPPSAERARTLAARAAHAALIGAPDGDDLRVAPTLHHVPATGAATLQFAADHPLVVAVRERGDGLLPSGSTATFGDSRRPHGFFPLRTLLKRFVVDSHF